MTPEQEKQMQELLPDVKLECDLTNLLVGEIGTVRDASALAIKIADFLRTRPAIRAMMEEVERLRKLAYSDHLCQHTFKKAFRIANEEVGNLQAQLKERDAENEKLRERVKRMDNALVSIKNRAREIIKDGLLPIRGVYIGRAADQADGYVVELEKTASKALQDSKS